MGWIRVSDDFYDNDKLSDVGPLGIALHFAAMGFCNRNLTDGYFKKSRARLLLDFEGIGITTARNEMCAVGVDGDDATKLVIEWMVAADLWHEHGHDCDECHARSDGGEPARNEYLVHDYLEYQPSRSDVEAKAEANRERVRKFAEKRRLEQDAAQAANALANALATEALMEQLHDTPTPTPTPSSSSIETSRGRVAKGNARDGQAPRPHCSKHEENHDGPCIKCKRRREWDEHQTAQAEADELETRRRDRERRDNCPICRGTSWVPDTEPAVKCNHQETAHG